MPSSSRGTTFAPVRTATVTGVATPCAAPARAISLAISPPELPTPTTSARRPSSSAGR
jgi:hypothetical protein